MEIDNPLNSDVILSPNNPQDNQDSINRSWYFNKTTTFSSFEEESIGLFNLMETSLTWIFITSNSKVFDAYLTQSAGYSLYSQLYFQMFFKFLLLRFNKAIPFLFFKLSETFCICLFSVLSQCYNWWNKVVFVMMGEK